MKLGSLKEGGRDGTLVVVSRDLKRAVKANGIAATMQAALDDWSNAAPRLNALSESLDAGRADGAFALDMRQVRAAVDELVRARQWSGQRSDFQRECTLCATGIQFLGQRVEPRRGARPVVERRLQRRRDAARLDRAAEVATDDDQCAVAAAFLE